MMTKRLRLSMKMARMRTMLVLAFVLAALLGVATPSAHAEQSDPDAVVAILHPDLDSFWHQVVGDAYYSPANVWWYNTATQPGGTHSWCGPVAVNNSVYCSHPSDQSIYLDYTFHLYHLQTHGDNASGLILAHEWAHHIQNILGFTAQWQAQQITTRAFELQADCFAGAYNRSAAVQGILEPSDYDDALLMVQAVGDDALGQPTGPGGHGTSEQRVAWFLYGYETGDPSVCTPYNYGY